MASIYITDYYGRTTTRCHHIEHDRWMTDPLDKDFLEPEARWCRVCAQLDCDHKTCKRCGLSFVEA